MGEEGRGGSGEVQRLQARARGGTPLSLPLYAYDVVLTSSRNITGCPADGVDLSSRQDSFRLSRLALGRRSSSFSHLFVYPWQGRCGVVEGRAEWEGRGRRLGRRSANL